MMKDKIIVHVREPPPIASSVKDEPKMVATIDKVENVASWDVDPDLPELVQFWLKTGG